MSYTVEERLSSAISNLNSALNDLDRGNVSSAKDNINEALRKMRHARDAVKGMDLGSE